MNSCKFGIMCVIKRRKFCLKDVKLPKVTELVRGEIGFVSNCVSFAFYLLNTDSMLGFVSIKTLQIQQCEYT